MNKKYIIIGLCLLIILYILYKNNKQQQSLENNLVNDINTESSKQNTKTIDKQTDIKLQEANNKQEDDNFDFSNFKNKFKDETKDLSDEERNQIITKTDEWCQETCQRIFKLSHGTTSDEQREEIVDLISECLTDADISKLINTYGRDTDGDSLPDVINWEMKLNGKARPMFTRLNENLKNNGCTYQFKLW